MTKITSQVARFMRVFVFAVLPAVLAIATGQSKITVAAVVAVVTPALEVAWRAIHPTTSAASTPPVGEPWRPV